VPTFATVVKTGEMSGTGMIERRIIGGPGVLSGREILTLNHAANGLADKQIAKAMNVQVSTVRTHWKRARNKLHALNRTHAVCIAVTMGVAGMDLTMTPRTAERELAPVHR
jgi:DNA-binding NarL/FixJ family response regulator